MLSNRGLLFMEMPFGSPLYAIHWEEFVPACCLRKAVVSVSNPIVDKVLWSLVHYGVHNLQFRVSVGFRAIYYTHEVTVVVNVVVCLTIR